MGHVEHGGHVERESGRDGEPRNWLLPRVAKPQNQH